MDFDVSDGNFVLIIGSFSVKRAEDIGINFMKRVFVRLRCFDGIIVRIYQLSSVKNLFYVDIVTRFLFFSQFNSFLNVKLIQ